MEIGNTIKASQATGPGEAVMLDESGMIPASFIPTSATGGGGSWVDQGAVDSIEWETDAIYRAWTSGGLKVFKYRSGCNIFLGGYASNYGSGSSEYSYMYLYFWSPGDDSSSASFGGNEAVLGGNLSEVSSSSYSESNHVYSVEKWVFE